MPWTLTSNGAKLHGPLTVCVKPLDGVARTLPTNASVQMIASSNAIAILRLVVLARSRPSAVAVVNHVLMVVSLSASDSSRR
jgi:hypothetical protein